MFRDLLNTKRCVLIVNGYYEWEESKDSSKPFYLKPKKDGDLLYLGCLYNNVFTERIGKDYNHFVVLTMEASDNVKSIHHRMPVILDDKTKEIWLS
jgi:putative SOS response-associated peptidase YedK